MLSGALYFLLFRGRNPMRRFALLVLAAGLMVAADDASDAVKKDKDALKGTWKVDLAERDGQEDLGMKGMTLTFDEKHVVMKPNMAKEMSCTYTLDPSKKPKVIKIKTSEG